MLGKSRLKGVLVCGLGFAALTAAILASWTMVKGSVPSVSHLEFWIWKTNLPFAISRWWDIPAAFIWGILCYSLLAGKENWSNAEGLIFKLRYKYSQMNEGVMYGLTSSLICNFAMLSAVLIRDKPEIPPIYFWSFGLINLCVWVIVSAGTGIFVGTSERIDRLGATFDAAFGAFLAYSLVTCFAYGLLTSLMVGLAIPVIATILFLATFLWAGSDDYQHA